MKRKFWDFLWIAILFVVSANQFAEHSYFWAVGALVYGIILLFRFIGSPVDSKVLLHALDVERRSNFQIEVTINLEELVKHDVLKHIHKSVSNNSEESFEDWGKRLIENYKIKNKKEHGEHKVKFNVKGGALYKDDKVSFFDAIYDEITVPLEAPKEDEKEPWDNHRLKHNITVRLFVVNGALNLEVGRYDKENSPKIYVEGFLAKYEQYTKITSFPMMFTCWSYGLPSKFLSLHFQATDYYKANFLVIDKNEKHEKSKTNEWRELHVDLAKYEELVESDEAWDKKGLTTFEKLSKDFRARAIKWLISERFVDPDEKKEDYSYWRWEDGSQNFNNKLLYIDLMDWNNRLETYKSNAYADYWEEQP